MEQCSIVLWNFIIIYKSISRILSQTFICETMSSTSTTTLVEGVVPLDLAATRKKNEDWIRAWRKANGVKSQATLPTKVEAHTAWVIGHGWAMRDAVAWKNLCEKAKFSASIPIDADLDLLAGTLTTAALLDTHPIGLICFARSELKQPEWTLLALDCIRVRFCVEICDKHPEAEDGAPTSPETVEVPDDDDAPSSPGGKKRRFEYSPTQHSEVSGEI